jgi:hypothetical protein
MDDVQIEAFGTDDLMKLAETSGAFDFWNDPAEDIYGPDDEAAQP